MGGVGGWVAWVGGLGWAGCQRWCGSGCAVWLAWLAVPLLPASQAASQPAHAHATSFRPTLHVSSQPVSPPPLACPPACLPAEEEALTALSKFPGVSIINDRAANRFPTPLDASNMDGVFVGRWAAGWDGIAGHGSAEQGWAGLGCTPGMAQARTTPPPLSRQHLLPAPPCFPAVETAHFAPPFHTGCLSGCRVRRDISRDDAKGLDLFVCGDQIKKGAALNAVQVRWGAALSVGAVVGWAGGADGCQGGWQGGRADAGAGAQGVLPADGWPALPRFKFPSPAGRGAAAVPPGSVNHEAVRPPAQPPCPLLFPHMACCFF